jgi:probable HAF family extracellular repeat protein
MRLFATILSFAFSLHAAQIFQVTALPSGTAVSATAFSIANSGVVAGSGHTVLGTTVALTWNGGHVSEFGGSADAVNNSGAVAGTSWTASGARATVWRDGSSSIIGNGDEGYATGINSTGQVVGSLTRDRSTRAFIDGADGLLEIDTPGTWASAYDIADSGSVVGTYQTNGAFGAFTWSQDSGTSLIGSLGGGNSWGMAINQNGVAVGSSLTSGGYLHAFAYDGIMRDLGTLGGKKSAAYDVNASGHVVGYSYDNQGQQRAFLWTNGMLFDLNALIGAHGWSLQAAYGINDHGQIVGVGMYGGSSTAFLLNPISPFYNSNASLPSVDVAAEIPEPASSLTFLGGAAFVAAGCVLRRRRTLP